MREAVIVIADLYLQTGEGLPGPDAAWAALPGLEHVGRFAARESLLRGWRAWLSGWLGRAELAGVAVAQVAAAAASSTAGGNATRWIATPVQLLAGLTRLHLPRDGILRLAPAEQAALVSAFERVFAGTEWRLEPLGDGQFLLSTPGIAPIVTSEPARCADGEVRVPQGLAAAPLLRLMAEIEMWLHAEPLNETRRRRGAPAVSGLWLWGADGDTVAANAAPRTGRAVRHSVAAFGRDAWLLGLGRLMGEAVRPIPERAGTLFAADTERVVVVAELAGGTGGSWSLPEASQAIDAQLIRPALAALRSGTLGRLTLIANDTRLSIGRFSALKRWRVRRPGLQSFAQRSSA